MRNLIFVDDISRWGNSVPNRAPVQDVITALLLSAQPDPSVDVGSSWRMLQFNLKTGWFLSKLHELSRHSDPHGGLRRVLEALADVVCSEDMASCWTTSFLPLLGTEVEISEINNWRLSMPSNSPLRHLAACSELWLSDGGPGETGHRWALLQHFLNNLVQSEEDLLSFRKECLLRGGST